MDNHRNSDLLNSVLVDLTNFYKTGIPLFRWISIRYKNDVCIVLPSVKELRGHGTLLTISREGKARI